MANGSHDQWSKIRQSPRDWRILRFLKRKPVPAKLTGELDDGEEITVALSKQRGNANAQWADATIALHPCVKIRALDAEGAILRVLELDPNDPELAAEASAEEHKSEQRARGRSSVSVISIDVPRLVDNVAKNLKEVAASAASMQATAFTQGFQAMTSVVNLCLSLLIRVDARLAETEAQAAQLTEGSGGQSMNPRDALVMMALQKAMGGGGPPAGVDPNLIATLLAQFQQSQGAGPQNGATNGHG